MRNWARCPPFRCSAPAMLFFRLPSLLYPGLQGWSDENPAPGGDTNAGERHDSAPHGFAVARATTVPGRSADRQWEQPRDRVVPLPALVAVTAALCPVFSWLRRLLDYQWDPPGCLNTVAVKRSRHHLSCSCPSSSCICSNSLTTGLHSCGKKSSKISRV
jgi:hypothetical protein